MFSGNPHLQLVEILSTDQSMGCVQTIEQVELYEEVIGVIGEVAAYWAID